MNQVNSTPSSLDLIESLAPLRQGADLKHSFYSDLIEGTLTAKQYDFFARQQAWIWYEISRNILLLLRALPPIYINSTLLRVAHCSLILADNLNDQVNDFKLETYDVPPTCKEYISFFRSLIDEKLILLLLVALMLRFEMMSLSCQRYLKLLPSDHPHKKFLEDFILLNAEEHLTRISNILDTQVQSISQKEKTAMKQVFLEAASYESRFLNEAYYLASI